MIANDWWLILDWKGCEWNDREKAQGVLQEIHW